MANHNREKDAVEEGSRLGHLNEPKTNALELSVPERDIIKKTEEILQTEYIHRKELLQGFEDNETQLEQEVNKITSGETVLEMGSEIEQAKIETKTNLYKTNEIRKEKDRAKKHCRTELKYAGVDAVEGSKFPIILTAVLIFLLLLGESAANSYFLGKGDSMGLLGGWLKACIIAGISVVFSGMAGAIYTEIKGPKTNESLVRTTSAVTWSVIVAILFVIYHTIIGWYRYAITYYDPEAAVLEAIPLFLENWWNLYDLHCWMLIMIGLLFAGIAFHSGVNFKKYKMLWKFAHKEEDYRKAGDKLTEIQGKYLSVLNEIFNKYMQKVRDLLENSSNIALEFREIYAHSKGVEDELVQIIAQEDRSLNFLLRSFREANIAVRDQDSPRPDYFLESVPINTEKYSFSNIGVLNRSKSDDRVNILFKDIKMSAQENRKEIKREYEKALHSSSEIIDSISNFEKEPSEMLKNEEMAAKSTPQSVDLSTTEKGEQTDLFNDIEDSENDVPSVELDNGYKAWYKDKQLHRFGGPAVIKANGNKSYYIKGKRLTEEEFKQRKEK